MLRHIYSKEAEKIVGTSEFDFPQQKKNGETL
jgi:hypothetical protein